jgi:acyl-CoA reductase-like NAD-dependent aldehyde dehydrogenase
MVYDIETSHFINGAFYPTPNAETFDVYNPSNETLVAKVPIATSAELDLAVKHAKEGQKVWGAMTPAERSVVMNKFADLIKDNAEELIWLDTQVSIVI